MAKAKHRGDFASEKEPLLHSNMNFSNEKKNSAQFGRRVPVEFLGSQELITSLLL